MLKIFVTRSRYPMTLEELAGALSVSRTGHRIIISSAHRVSTSHGACMRTNVVISSCVQRMLRKNQSGFQNHAQNVIVDVAASRTDSDNSPFFASSAKDALNK